MRRQTALSRRRRVVDRPRTLRETPVSGEKRAVDVGEARLEGAKNSMRSLASIQTVNTVEPIANADAIERIRVLGWWVVVKKGEFRAGDKVVYCEIDSLLPERPEFEFLRASSFKPAQTSAAGEQILPAGFRIKTVKL